jgi:hypothetical protein
MVETAHESRDSRFAEGPTAIAVSFDLGWSLTELHFSKLPQRGQILTKADAANWEGGLPELSDLPGVDRAYLIAKRIQEELSLLEPVKSLKLDVNFDAVPVHLDNIQTAVFDLHLSVFRELAAEPRFELAYRLGVALAHTVLSVRQPARSSFVEELGWGRVQTLLEWLDELKRFLPSRSAKVVSITLERWRDWSRDKPPDYRDARATQALRQQGQVWRGLLSGELSPEDRLTPSGYAAAGAKMTRQIGGLLGRFILSPTGLAVVVVVLVLVLAATWLFDTGVSTDKLVAILVGLGGPIGLTAASAQATLNRTINSLQAPLWEAVLTEAMGEAAYVEPNRAVVIESRAQTPTESQASAEATGMESSTDSSHDETEARPDSGRH